MKVAQATQTFRIMRKRIMRTVTTMMRKIVTTEIMGDIQEAVTKVEVAEVVLESVTRSRNVESTPMMES